jgi:hypothetical protein
MDHHVGADDDGPDRAHHGRERDEAGRVLYATPGFVIEVRLIRHVLWWRADGPRLEYEQLTVPLEVPDTPEEQP